MASKTALVVDDSKSARFALRRFLENKGYTVDTAENAPEAYAYLKRRRPDVVFLDHMMPGVSGFDALRTIRMELDMISLPVVICSSNEGDAFVREARAQGADDVLPKPPNELHINAVLDRLLKAAAPAPADEATAAATPPPAMTPPASAAPSMAPPTMASPRMPEPKIATPAPRSVEPEPIAAAEREAIDATSADLPLEVPATPPPAVAAAPTNPIKTTGASTMEQKVASTSPDSAAKGGSEIERKLKELADKIEALNRTVAALGNRLDPILRPAPASAPKSSAPADAGLSRVAKSVVESTHKLTEIEAAVQSLIDRSDV
jgi:CheY-like chemotaxis protein